MVLRKWIGIFLLLFSFLSMGQSLSFKLQHATLKSPIVNAGVNVLETDYWTVSDENGFCVIPTGANSRLTISIQHIGMQRFVQPYSVKELNDSVVVIYLLPQTYNVSELNVNAQRSSNISSATLIDNTAKEHIQAISLADVLQLLPGSLLSNPDLSQKQNLSIREVKSDYNSSLGTALIIDGTPVNSDGDFQTYLLLGC